MPTKQEIFDKVKAHLLKQKKQAANEDGGCLYRGPEGTKCAIGCLIPDELYDPKMERKGPWHLMTDFPEVNEFIYPSDIGYSQRAKDFLNKLQELHDETDPLDWKEQLEDFADAWGLEP